MFNKSDVADEFGIPEISNMNFLATLIFGLIGVTAVKYFIKIIFVIRIKISTSVHISTYHF